MAVGQHAEPQEGDVKSKSSWPQTQAWTMEFLTQTLIVPDTQELWPRSQTAEVQEPPAPAPRSLGSQTYPRRLW